MAEASNAYEKPEQTGLETYKRMLEDALTLTDTARREAQVDNDYYNGYQWTAEERRALRERKQPDNVFNRVRPAVAGTLGVLEQGQSDPRAYPRNPGDEDASDVATKTLRFIGDQNRFDRVQIDGAEDFLVNGTCAAIVEMVDDEIRVEQIRFEEFFYDPRSRKHDFSDARYMGVAKWLYADDVAKDYPAFKAELEAAVAEATPGVLDQMQDRPTDSLNTVGWADGKKRRLMVVELYHQEGGQWFRCVFFSNGVLEKGPSPYLDEKRRPINPIEAQSCFIDRENNRFGIVRDMRGPQDEINKRRSKLLALVSSRQVQEAEPGAMASLNPDEVRAEAARPDGVLPSGLQIVPTADMSAGQSALLQMSIAEIERMGPNPAILGRQAASSSGRAQMVRQQAGLTEQALVFGRIEDWVLRLYRQMWLRARQFWNAPKWIRITDDNDAPVFIGLNQPQMIVDPATGQPMPGPVQNEIARLDVDIILDSVPDTANLQQEQFAMMVELAKVGALGRPEQVGPLLLEASSLPNKRVVLDKLKGEQETPEAQQAAGVQQQIAMRGAAAEIAEKEAGAAYKQAQAADKSAQTQERLLDVALKGAAAGVGPLAAPPMGPQGPVTGFPG